jgi:DNA-binding transcriptional regulator YhcF (GntR family)
MPQIPRTSAPEQVFRRLVAGVLSGRYAPGERLPPQRTLAADLGVNMATVREAVKRLEQLKLVETRHGDGMRVRDWRAQGGLDVLVHAVAERGALDPALVREVFEARRQLLGELVRAWVDEIPEAELASHYAKALTDLDEHDLSMLAAWHASMECGTPIANRDFLVNAFPSLGEARREALKIAAGMRGEEAFNAGVAEEQALETVLPWLSEERCEELAAECLELYCWDRLGSEN